MDSRVAKARRAGREMQQLIWETNVELSSTGLSDQGVMSQVQGLEDTLESRGWPLSSALAGATHVGRTASSTGA
jgi:hypothetical protein